MDEVEDPKSKDDEHGVEFVEETFKDLQGATFKH